MLINRQVIVFGIVGLFAAGVHFTVVNLLVHVNWQPLVANVYGFLCAFLVSFTGHHVWSFAAKSRKKSRALGRFFVVAVISFLLNEFCYWLLLRYTKLDYRFSLILVIGGVAVLTFFSSKYWAFRHE